MSNIATTDSQDDIPGPNILEKYREEVSKRMKSDKSMDTLAGYTSSINHTLKDISEQKLI